MRAVSLCLSAVWVLFTTPAWSHPHGWIDMQSKVVFDAEGRVTALVQAWLFDELYSTFILDEIALSGEPREDALAAVAAQDVATLAAYDYFTRFEVAGEIQDLGTVETYSTGVAEGRIWLRFELPLARPVDPAADAVSYAVYDPTYYIEVLHVGAEPVQLEGEGGDRCGAELVDPEPSPETVSLAAALDISEVATGDLGRHFAQWVTLACAAS